MESSRKRFRADISDVYIKSMFNSSRRAKRPNLGAPENGCSLVVDPSSEAPSIKSITAIPVEMLPKTRAIIKQRLQKELVHPDHWAGLQRAAKKSREEVFQAEKDSIEKQLNQQQVWSRAALALSSAKRPLPKVGILEEELGRQMDGPVTTKGNAASLETRGNSSKEFLQLFFKTATNLAAEEKHRQSTKRAKRGLSKTPKRKPKLAYGIEPGADEVTL